MSVHVFKVIPEEFLPPAWEDQLDGENGAVQVEVIGTTERYVYFDVYYRDGFAKRLTETLDRLKSRFPKSLDEEGIMRIESAMLLVQLAYDMKYGNKSMKQAADELRNSLTFRQA